MDPQIKSADILVADDDSSILTMVKRSLSHSRYTIRTASDGDKAILMAREEKPSLIILDIHMPGKDGWEVIKEIRRSPATRLTPIILLTGDTVESSKVAGLEMGADDYITKPFTPGELKARVESLLRRTRAASAANPLTLLPGASAIEDEALRRMRRAEPFELVYVDIDNFKSYNDYYGYFNGDRVILKTAEILGNTLAETCGPDGFLGHIGGDDFAAITRPGFGEVFARFLIPAFDGWSPSAYGEEERTQGSIKTSDRNGEMTTFPLITLSIAITDNKNRPCSHYAQIVESVSQVKQYLKKRKGAWGSAFLRDRRA